MSIIARVSYTYIFFLLLFLQSLYSQCPSGDVILESQAQMNDFTTNFPNCVNIEGDLIIGFGVTDISNLPPVQTVGGSLRISSPNINSIAVFDNLESVGVDLQIFDTSELTEIIGFDALMTVGGDLVIEDNNIGVTGLERIEGFSNLTNISGNLNIDSNLVLTEVIGFENLNFIGRSLAFNNHNSLALIPEFNSLNTIGNSLFFTSNDVLESVSGFSSLETIGELADQVDNRVFYVWNNTNLISLTGFENLEIIDGFIDFSGLNLSVITDFPSLTTVNDGFEISNTSLETLSGFNSLTNIGDWFILTGNNSLIDLNGFNSLTQIGGVVQIITNDSLESIIGFNQLTIVGGLFQINVNPSLTSLDGLESLIQVAGPNFINDFSFLITDNVSLTDCSAICNLLVSDGITGFVDISGNPSMCSSREEIEQDCVPDFDNDGILNDDDLDDDNDGILDEVEQDGDENRDTDSDGYPDHMDYDSDNDGCFDVIESGFTDNDQNGTLGTLPDNVDANGLIIGELNGYSTPLDINSNSVLDFQEFSIFSAGENANLEICINSGLVNLFDSLNGSPDSGGTWSPILSSGSGIFNPLVDSSGTYTYTIDNGLCGTSSSEVNVSVYELPNAGENGILELCESDGAVDLINYLNGIPDLGGIWSPSLSSGSGMFDPSVDVSGTYIYTVESEFCESSTAEVNVIVSDSPNSGEDGVLEICINSGLVNLFDSLNGSPDSGGTWSPILSSGSGIFNPLVDSSGTYTYTIDNGLCGTSSSEVNVSVYELPNAGENGILELCESDSSVDLINYLNGIPDPGGIWSPSLSSGSGIFNPSVDISGTYIYTVESVFCGSSTAEVNVIVNDSPNSGEDGILEICINSGLVNLFDSLNGSPDSGGTWSPILSSGSGIFNPLVDSSGTYTYTIDNGLCGMSFSEVEVTVTQFTPITSYEIIIVELSLNNSIEVLIDSNLEYQFSLDGLNYQNSNVFNNLIGGDYTVYVKEVNGCGILEELVTIIDYPKYFTPNGDNNNDFWGLRGNTDRLYSVFIYDRYGKLLKSITQNGGVWDGKYNGQDMPANDYWFEIVFEDGQSKSGHFSLKR
ncbi:T9SS type B sorting domain-containing protein [Winogradskyella poriferorum]|uniref:T9SS type B sorting domain-containing protein n=1 Tax=Winogradskyella poriferorum TaxID=307627 RepID=A0ABU7W7L2_9FLAO